MEIQKVLLLEKGGYKVNNQYYIPEDKNDNNYKDILDWVSEGGVIEKETDNIDYLSRAKNIKIDKCKEYLVRTDWYCLRFADRGIEYPQEVKDKREQARNYINDIEALNTKEEVEAYNIDPIL